jgi:Domain of unknown function (DUF4326)
MSEPKVATVPRRIQRRRTAGWKLPEGAICVTRPGKWGNPFVVGEAIERDSDLWPYIADLVPGIDDELFPGAKLSSVTLSRAEDAVEAHFRWFLEQPALMITVERELGGHDLACYCKPGAPCHADTLLLAAAGWPDAMIEG